MDRSNKLQSRRFFALLLILLVATGCQNLQIPRIDPSGQSVFMPAPNYTTPEISCLQQPAFVTPEQAPPCDALAATPSPIACAPSPATPQPAVAKRINPKTVPLNLTLTPSRVVAPVGSEVVLIAGLCGSDGRYVMRKKVEWSLAQESVGSLVEIGGMDRKCFLRTSKKPSGDLASSYSSTTAKLITRGTADRTDDIWIREGQTYVSVTSAAEGVSHITAFSPEIETWAKRQQTASIHWVNARWLLPSPGIAKAGVPHPMTTTLTRQTTGDPISGWIVRYEIVGGTPAGLMVPGSTAPQQTAEVVSDGLGRARVELAPTAAGPGLTQVRVQILQPGNPGSDVARLRVGQGWTQVTWSAPGLAVKVNGPEKAGVDTNVTYRIVVSNPGDLPTPAVVLSDTLPTGLTYTSSTPSGSQYGHRIEWRVGELGAKASQVFEVHCRADREVEAKHCVSARSNGLSAEDCFTTSITRPALSVALKGPLKAQVGEVVQYQIVITNLTRRKLTGLMLNDVFDVGLQHGKLTGQKIRRPIGDLDPGQTRDDLAVVLNVVSTGKHCNSIEITSDSGESASDRLCLTAEPSPLRHKPGLSLKHTGTTTAKVGEAAKFSIVATNTGDVVLNNVRIEAQYSESLRLTEATAGFLPNTPPGMMVWNIATLSPGETVERYVNATCFAPSPNAFGRVTATSSQGPTVVEQARIAISAPATVVTPPVDPKQHVPETTDPPVQPDTGKLTVKISNASNPTRAGAPLTYIIEVMNGRRSADKNVATTIHLPPGYKVEDLRGPETDFTSSPDGRSVAIEPIKSVRAGERIVFYLKTIPSQVGRQQVKVEVKSLRQSTAATAVVETTVSGP